MTPHQAESTVFRSRRDAAKVCGSWDHLTMSDTVAELVEKLDRVASGYAPLLDLPYAIFTAVDAGDHLRADVVEGERLQAAAARAHVAAERDLPPDFPRDRLLRGMAALSQFLAYRSESRSSAERDGTYPARLRSPAERTLKRYAEPQLFLADPRDQRDAAVLLAHDLRRYSLEFVIAARGARLRGILNAAPVATRAA